MSIIKINALSVPEGRGEELEKRFAARKHAVDAAPGFEGFQLLRPTAGEDRYFVVTQWADEESYAQWRDGEAQSLHSHGRGESHENAASSHSGGQTPVAQKSELLEFDVVLDSTR
ncbi:MULTISPECIES: antibiotic biosynthesis monooxygenase family protein [Corynebacterium]|uniref:Antibiotic biosynthesis monooxygenase n=1 Tax=Corynebacterium ramonii TaxID=3026968 RepID=A0ABN4EK58_9CORY|nr:MULTISPECIES: antibiotic biosynthesis monooxygenase [Corynebacterium]AIU33278.1 Antibiotic biosynthesis monooxygenase [Corynebacterium ramonii FRC0011]ESU58082.1 monooxygenase [Corynebacterium ulcerans NCTC 12077]OAG70725.1 antibiotic biosynthesis monooxygenase [Corynebacterium ulcerans]STC82924.1 antibiotic biosynthesis monooxygenase [Corynebacterium ulcerans]